MSDLTFPPPHSENMELAAANRRLTTAILGMTLLTGLVACLSYLAGRTVTHMRTETAAVVRTEIPPGPVVITPMAPAAPTVATVKPSPIAPRATPATPLAGLYFQVGLINPSVDRSMQDRLTQKGFSVKLAPMENSSVSRLLVGPIQTPEEQRELSAKLSAEGLQYFPRRF